MVRKVCFWVIAIIVVITIWMVNNMWQGVAIVSVGLIAMRLLNVYQIEERRE